MNLNPSLSRQSVCEFTHNLEDKGGTQLRKVGNKLPIHTECNKQLRLPASSKIAVEITNLPSPPPIVKNVYFYLIIVYP